MRMLGGVGVALRCPSARSPSPLARAFSDLDVATDRRSAGELGPVLEAVGYVGERRFNALHGHRRQLFVAPGGRHIDVFVGEFAMCHALSLTDRLAAHDETIPLADLLLTKLQVAELNDKDVTDVVALLLDHELAVREPGLDVERVTKLLGQDWGWWRTASANLGTVRSLVATLPLPPEASRLARARLDELLGRIDAAPKTRRWRLRARIGDRMPWRDEPEEIQST